MPATQGSPAPEIEAFVAEYLTVWSAGDAAGVWSRYYRLEPGHGLKSEADVAALLSGLRAEGYDHTEIRSLEAHYTGADDAVARLGYSRRLSDGSAMPPELRWNTYVLHRFEDGWRMTRLIPE
jgi:hypothetical protein